MWTQLFQQYYAWGAHQTRHSVVARDAWVDRIEQGLKRVLPFEAVPHHGLALMVYGPIAMALNAALLPWRALRLLGIIDGPGPDDEGPGGGGVGPSGDDRLPPAHDPVGGVSNEAEPDLTDLGEDPSLAVDGKLISGLEGVAERIWVDPTLFRAMSGSRLLVHPAEQAVRAHRKMRSDP